MLPRLIVSVFMLAVVVGGLNPLPVTASGFYRARGDEPSVRAILYSPRDARAWIYHDGRRHHAVEKMHLDREWHVEEIRRRSVLFRRSSTRNFVEIPVKLTREFRFHRDWSFLGQPIGLWEALELISRGFGYHIVMHYQAGGSVVPANHANTVYRMLRRVLPDHHRFVIEGPVVYVLPVHPAGEDYRHVLDRMKQRNPQSLVARFPSLERPGTIISRGNDIQFVLRQIALGGKVPIQFHKDLHFPVYAYFRDVPFCKILAKIVYLNQCIIIEREEGLEVHPWPRQIIPRVPPIGPAILTADREEPQKGAGPQPPPNKFYDHFNPFVDINGRAMPGFENLPIPDSLDEIGSDIYEPF